MSFLRSRTTRLIGALGAVALGLSFLLSGNGGTNVAVPDEGATNAQPTLPKGVKDADDLPDKERVAYEDALLESAVPAPDKDGDPRTIAGALPDGRRVVVFVQTSKPEDLEGVDIDEFSDGGR